MLQAGSLGCRLGWSLVLGCVRGCPWGQHWSQEGRNRVRQRKGSSWITGQTTWADPMGVWSDDGPSGLSWHIQWPGLYTSTWMDHCMQAAPRGAGGLRLPTGSIYSCWTTSPWRETGQHISMFPLGMYHSSRGRWWGCTVGETLDDWCLSQNDDSGSLLNTLWSKK